MTFIPKEISCKVCGEVFMAEKAAQKLCSDKCRETTKAQSREEWRKKNPKVWCSYTNKYREKYPHRARLSAIKSKCTKEGLPFDLTEEWLEIPETCPVLGIPLDGSTRDNQWSFDRIVPEKGYTKDNVRVISMRANRLKNDSTYTELKRILEYIEKNS